MTDESRLVRSVLVKTRSTKGVAKKDGTFSLCCCRMLAALFPSRSYPPPLKKLMLRYLRPLWSANPIVNNSALLPKSWYCSTQSKISYLC